MNNETEIKITIEKEESAPGDRARRLQAQVLIRDPISEPKW